MEILSYNQNNPLPKSPAQLQQNLHHGSMVSLLQGMTSLARFADSLFTSIAKETNETFQRIDKLSNRVEQAQQESAIAHESILKLTLTQMLQNYKAKYSVEKVVPKLIVHPSNRPFQVEQAYKNAQTLPNFEKMQSVSEDGKEPAKMYSDPGFFYEDWRQQEKRRQEFRREQRRKKDLERSDSNRKKPASIKKYRWDPVTGARMLISEAECNAPVEIQIPLPCSDIIILDEEFLPPAAVNALPAVAPLPAASSHRVATPSRRGPTPLPSPQPGENQNDIVLPRVQSIPPAAISRADLSPAPTRPVDLPTYQPPASLIPVPPPLPPALPTQASSSTLPCRRTAPPNHPLDPRSSLLEQIRNMPTCVLRAPHTRPQPAPLIRNNGDKSLLVNIIRERIDVIRDAVYSSSEDEPETEGSTSDWD